MNPEAIFYSFSKGLGGDDWTRGILFDESA